MANAPSVLFEGLVIADTYEIERPLGRGGMGEVWLAKHRRLAGKQVAIKVLHLGATGANSEVLARFKREAEIAARLEHPNIVQVLDFNTLPSGEPFLVMEVLKGEPLAARLRNGALPLAEVQAIVRQAGSALAAAHAAGVVHRDLKPDNLFVVPTALGDQVKVLDFGISKLADSQTVQTTDSVLIGTPLYMSPEQALGQNRDITAQSDIFSLGSICYELLTGTAPFQADNIAKVVFRIAYEPHASLAAAAPHLPPHIVKAVDRALAKKREERTPDVSTFVLEFTGQPLGQVLQQPLRDSGRGLLTPGAQVNESMMGAATVTPSTGRASQPPPVAPEEGFGPTLASGSVAKPVVAPPGPVVAPVAAPVPAPADPRLVPAPKPKGALMVGSLLAAVLVTGLMWVVFGRTPPVVPGAAVDAGAPVAVVVAPLPVAAVDAGAQVVEAAVDAGAPAVVAAAVVDAGAVAIATRPVEPKDGPLSAEDQAVVDEVEALLAAGKYDELGTRFGARSVGGRGARKRYYTALVAAQCQRHDLSKVNQALAHLQESHPLAAKIARARCHQAWPDFGP